MGLNSLISDVTLQMVSGIGEIYNLCLLFRDLVRCVETCDSFVIKSVKTERMEAYYIRNC